MKRHAGMMIVVMGVLLGAQTIAAQEWSQPWARERIEKSPRHSEWVTVKHDGRNVETLVVYPESKDKRPVVLVIHEIFGLSDWAQELADEVAAAGYIAVAPDLLSGMAPNAGRTKDFLVGVTEAVSKLDPDQVTADLTAAADYGLKLPATNGKLYVAGFCWGAMSHIKAPVYGFYAENDARIDATIPDTVSEMKAAGKTYDPVTYDGAGHGFMRAGEAPDASDANKKARDDAWKRWKSLLAP
jgi:carboxymethylenebutenolidase